MFNPNRKTYFNIYKFNSIKNILLKKSCRQYPNIIRCRHHWCTILFVNKIYVIRFRGWQKIPKNRLPDGWRCPPLRLSVGSRASSCTVWGSTSTTPNYQMQSVPLHTLIFLCLPISRLRTKKTNEWMSTKRNERSIKRKTDWFLSFQIWWMSTKEFLLKYIKISRISKHCVHVN